MGRDECREIEGKVREGKAQEYRSATQSDTGSAANRPDNFESAG